MAEPSYYPLRPLRREPSSEQPAASLLDPGQDPGQHTAASGAGSLSTMPFFRHFHSQPRQGRPSPDRPTSWRLIKAPLTLALFPLAAIAYLAFCYTVHGMTVPVNTYGLYAITPQHLSIIKGGITTISIIVISIALYPIYGIVSSLKSEEFFRVLEAYGQGVPLHAVNQISNPTFGDIDMLVAMWKHTCSNYYIIGIFASLLIFIVTTFAPGILTVSSVLSDGELMAFAVGAVPIQSVLNGSYIGEPSLNASMNADAAASIVWAEMELDVQYSFGIASVSEPADYVAYIVPVPLDLNTTTKARWLTDVIGINPICSWATTNITGTMQIPINTSTFLGNYLTTVYLVDFNLDVPLTESDIPGVPESYFAAIRNPSNSVVNHTTQAPPSDGSTVFLLGNCASGCIDVLFDVVLDLSNITTVFTLAFTDQAWTMAILTCQPNIMIETREVRNDGQGTLTVQPLPTGYQLARQGNLNLVQTTALFSFATMSLTQSAGPLTGNRTQFSMLGSQVQGDLLYGKDQFDNLTTNAQFGMVSIISPAPIENITEVYTRILQSVAKSYLAGYLGTAYVPGRISATEIIFAAAIPNLAVSTAVFALLAGVIILANLRPKQRMEFTLVNVAAALHDSELPARFAQAKTEEPATDADADLEIGEMRNGESSSSEQDILEMLGERRIFMDHRENGSPVLHIS